MRQLAFETSGSLPARFVSLVAAGNVNSSQLAIVGSDLLSASCSGGPTPIFASGRPCAGCTWACGGDLKPYCLTAVGTFSRLWIVGIATIRQQAFGGKLRRITACKRA